MSTAAKWNFVSVEDYLAGELRSDVKHEYVAGIVYAMSGARNIHNLLATNILGTLFGRLRGKPCRPFNSDTKVRIDMRSHLRFYYPDVQVVCRSNPGRDSFQDEPVVVVEVLSQRTRRIDVGEKKDGYLSIPSLAVYLLVEQESAMVVAFRRTKDGFVREVYEGLNATVPLTEIDTELPLNEVYDSVPFAPEPEEE
jgi:Uma2 family endonuclease